MATVSFDGSIKCIIISFANGESVASLDFGDDIYSEWKRWVRQGYNAKFLQAIQPIGGQDKGGGKRVGTTFFLLNDWHMCPDPVEPVTELEIIDEVLPEVAGQPIYSTQLVDLGQSMIIQRTVPTTSETIEVNTGSGVTAQDKQDIIDGVWNKTLP